MITLHHSSVIFLLNKVFVTDSIYSEVEKIAYGLDLVFQVISFSANGRIFYFREFFCDIAHSCLFFFLNGENFIFEESSPYNNHM